LRFCRFSGRVLRAAALWVLVASVFVSVPHAYAGERCASYDTAWSKCQTEATSYIGVKYSSAYCEDTPPRISLRYVGVNGISGTNTYSYTCPTGWTKCDNATPYPASYGSNITVCRAGCIYKPNEGSAERWTVTGFGGSFRAGKTSAMYEPTGEQCPTTTPEPPMASGRLCGGGSCYDTATNNYCAVSGGAQLCVKGPTSGGGGGGGCGSSGDTTLCAGNPPPMPPNPPIADPVTDIGASDTYGHQSGNGPVTNVTVNNYNNSGAAPSNGATSGDTAPSASGSGSGSGGNPAPSGSTGGSGDPTSASGGGTCNTPPICEGAAATCMVVTQTWLARCQGDGSASNDGDTSVPGLDGIGDGTVTGGGKPWFQDGGSIMSKLDATGLGGAGVCPAMPTISIPMANVVFDQEWPQWCEILNAAGVVILLLAGFIALRIISE